MLTKIVLNARFKHLKSTRFYKFGSTEDISTENAAFVSVNYSGNRAAKIEAELRKKGFTEVKVSEERNIIVLRGKIPKGKMAEVVQLAQEANDGKPINNEMTEF